jgi:hypothetical protein
MSPPNISVLSVSRFDGKKLLVIMSIAVITLVLDSQIGYIADFIPEELASSWGIAMFVVIWAIFAVTQYYILAYVKQNNNESRAKARYLNLIHRIVTIAQFVLAGVIAFVILQILIAHEYITVMLLRPYAKKLGIIVLDYHGCGHGLLSYLLSSFYSGIFHSFREFRCNDQYPNFFYVGSFNRNYIWSCIFISIENSANW